MTSNNLPYNAKKIFLSGDIIGPGVPPLEDYQGGKYPGQYVTSNPITIDMIENLKGAPGDIMQFISDNWYWFAAAAMALILIWSFRKN